MTLALYRRYRPDTFDEMIGQDHVVEPLRRAIDNDRITHAYLFSGPHGCGKTTTARILARCLNCEKGPTSRPCGECRSCVELARGGSGSLDVIEIDAASHGKVEDTRDLRERAAFSPVADRFKIYIIDEAHMVTKEGFNALLKLVEEPPEHVKFIFATTEPEKVLGTIRSRTHHYPFRLVPPRVLQDYLAGLCESEHVTIEPTVLPLVVRAGAGSVRDALSVLDQLMAGAAEGGVTYTYASALLGYTDTALLDDVVDALAAHDGASVFEAIDRVVEGGLDPRRFVTDLLERVRDLVILDALPDSAEQDLVHAPADQVERMRDQAARMGGPALSRAADVLAEGLTEMRGATAPRLQLELICARLLLPGADDGERGLRVRLETVERRVSAGLGVDAAQPDAPARPPRRATSAPAAAPQTSPAPTPSAPSEVIDVVAVEETAQTRSSTAAPETTAEAGPSAPAPSGSVLDIHEIRRTWPQVLESVKSKRRVTWMLLFEKVNVLSLDGDRLCLAFPDAGSAKGFGSGGHDETVRASLLDVLGVNWQVEAVVDRAAAARRPSESSGASATGGSGPDPFAVQPAETEVDIDTDADELTGEALLAQHLGATKIAEYDAD